jgi:hypothetical protein
MPATVNGELGELGIEIVVQATRPRSDRQIFVYFYAYLSISIMSQPFFPSIGSVAAKADELRNTETEHTDADSSADNDRPLQEIESLCMKCEEQVS